jgi:glycosyltransferase involved in cell wall biosynthesis
MTSCIDFSIITPSLNMLTHLKKCSPSIQDQQNVRLEHIVIDGASTDGTAEWLQENRHIESVSETDGGMYDAINKGFGMAGGELLAYLNCDEQYLPGTLGWVKDYFESHSDVDMIFSNAYLIRPDGSLVAFRKSSKPRWYFILASHLYVLTCTMFFRRRIIDDGFLMDSEFKIWGDVEFVVRLLRNGYSVRHVDRYLSVYTMTGKNLSKDAGAFLEKRRLMEQSPHWIRKLSWLLNAARLTEKFLSGAYYQKKPFEYSVYTDERERKYFRVDNASFKWRYE